MTALRWLARLVFTVALVTWLWLALKAASGPESWAAARKRTGAFVVMVAAGVVTTALAKQPAADEGEDG